MSANEPKICGDCGCDMNKSFWDECNEFYSAHKDSCSLALKCRNSECRVRIDRSNKHHILNCWTPRCCIPNHIDRSCAHDQHCRFNWSIKSSFEPRCPECLEKEGDWFAHSLTCSKGQPPNLENYDFPNLYEALAQVLSMTTLKLVTWKNPGDTHLRVTDGDTDYIKISNYKSEGKDMCLILYRSDASKKFKTKRTDEPFDHLSDFAGMRNGSRVLHKLVDKFLKYECDKCGTKSHRDHSEDCSHHFNNIDHDVLVNSRFIGFQRERFDKSTKSEMFNLVSWKQQGDPACTLLVGKEGKAEKMFELWVSPDLKYAEFHYRWDYKEPFETMFFYEMYNISVTKQVDWFMTRRYYLQKFYPLPKELIE